MKKLSDPDWTSAAGQFTTVVKATVQFVLLEFSETRIVHTDLQDFGIVPDFGCETIILGDTEIPMNRQHSRAKTLLYVEEPDGRLKGSRLHVQNSGCKVYQG